MVCTLGSSVIPAKAGIQGTNAARLILDTGFRRYDIAIKLTQAVLIAALLFMLQPGYARAPAVRAEPAQLKIATFDSGFGGFFTAKAIEQASREILRDYDAVITIRHYGDTHNSPYGEKTPEQIAALGSAGVIKTLDDGANLVFVACNTASTQYDKIKQAVERAHPGRSADVISIIEASALRAKEIIDQKLAHSDEASFVVLATPATVKNMAYPRELAALYQAPLQEQAPKSHTQERWFKQKGATVESLTQENTLKLANGKTIHLYQLAPANWVDLIERGGNLAEKNRAIKRDLNLMFSQLPEARQLDGAGYFCTHFPVFDQAIQQETSRERGGERMEYIAQGALMAAIFRDKAQARLKHHRRSTPASAAELERLVAQSRASITLSGDNIEVTRRLAQTMFADDPPPKIIREDFAAGARNQMRAR